jgi:hypothetical protein
MFTLGPRPPRKPLRDIAEQGSAPDRTDNNEHTSNPEDEPTPSLAFFIGGTTEGPPGV